MTAKIPADAVHNEAEQQRVTNAVKGFEERRAVIEQAKGVLMFLYDVDDAKAFELLRWQSQVRNLKLRDLAEQVLHDLLGLAKTAEQRAAADDLFLSAHERVARPTDAGQSPS
jgi:hypothetical protein